MMLCICPASTARSTPSSACRPPNRRLTFFASRYKGCLLLTTQLFSRLVLQALLASTVLKQIRKGHICNSQEMKKHSPNSHIHGPLEIQKVSLVLVSLILLLTKHQAGCL